MTPHTHCFASCEVLDVVHDENDYLVAYLERTGSKPLVLGFSNWDTMFDWLATVGSAEDCFQVGECVKSFQLHIESSADEFACLDVCKSYENCNWMTFDLQLAECRLFFNCTAVDAQECPECLSSRGGDFPWKMMFLERLNFQVFQVLHH